METKTIVTVRRENEYRLGLGEVIVAHGVHPEYGVPFMTFTKARKPGQVGSDARDQVQNEEMLDSMILVFCSADSMQQHLDRLQLAMNEVIEMKKGNPDA